MFKYIHARRCRNTTCCGIVPEAVGSPEEKVTHLHLRDNLRREFVFFKELFMLQHKDKCGVGSEVDALGNMPFGFDFGKVNRQRAGRGGRRVCGRS